MTCSCQTRKRCLERRPIIRLTRLGTILLLFVIVDVQRAGCCVSVRVVGGAGGDCGAAVCVSRTVVTDAATRIKAKESNAAAALFHHFCLHKYLFSLVSVQNNPVTPNCCFSNACTHTHS